ncbi:MAG: hypothetical protein VXX95_02265 [Candidatus Thermoplasmatota archaeon]|nr:hypothetical protein [Candidatus Thermoplasmatota archaeon]
MADDETRPKAIRMTVPSDTSSSAKGTRPDEKTGSATPSYTTSDGVYLMWTAVSVLVFIMVSYWSMSWWSTPLIFFGMLFVYLTFVMVFRVNMLQKADPHLQHESIAKNCIMSLIVVLGGYATAILLIAAYFIFILF